MCVLMKFSFLISRLQQGSKHKFNAISLPFYKPWIPVLELLYVEGYIQNFVVDSDFSRIFVYFRFLGSKSSIRTIQNFHKLSAPIFLTYRHLWKFDKNLGTLVLSTSKGILSHEQCLSGKLGGRLLFFIA